MALSSKRQSPQLQGNNGRAPIKAVLYARVYSDEQARKETIETQVHYAKQQCEKEKIPLLKIYKDEGVSGTVPFEQRAGAKRLLADARQEEFDLVLVYKVDRLGRLNVISHVALHHLETLGVGLRSLTEPFDTSTPSGRFMFSILVANSAMERENIRQRSKDGVFRLANEGKWATGIPPYGYRIENHNLVIDEEKAKVVRLIYEMAAKRNPLFKITQALKAQNILPTRGKEWRLSSVARIIHRPVYRGVHEWGIKESFTLSVPKIVPDETWQKAQDCLIMNAKANPRNSKRHYLLKSLIKCGLCRRSMVGITVKSKGLTHSYYRCISRSDPHTNIHCTSRYPRADWIESLIWRTLSGWILDREDLETALRKAMEEQEHEREELAKTVARLRRQIEEKSKEHDRIIGAFRKGLISENDLGRQLTEIDNEKTSLVQVVSDMEQRNLHVSTAQLIKAVHEQLDAYEKDIKSGSLSFERKRHIVESFIHEIRVRIPKGVELNGKIRQILPVRESAPDGKGAYRTFLKKNSKAESTPGVEVVYRFPLPDTKSLLVTDSHCSPGTRK